MKDKDELTRLVDVQLSVNVNSLWAEVISFCMCAIILKAIISAQPILNICFDISRFVTERKKREKTTKSEIKLPCLQVGVLGRALRLLASGCCSCSWCLLLLLLFCWWACRSPPCCCCARKAGGALGSSFRCLAAPALLLPGPAPPTSHQASAARSPPLSAAQTLVSWDKSLFSRASLFFFFS